MRKSEASAATFPPSEGGFGSENRFFFFVEKASSHKVETIAGGRDSKLLFSLASRSAPGDIALMIRKGVRGLTTMSQKPKKKQKKPSSAVSGIPKKRFSELPVFVGPELLIKTNTTL